ncbi:MAG: PilZ domain-containing protein [Acidobacteriia bacterium]|nr:PilZ domain-containing protein [Terriglobia bacterium]
MRSSARLASQEKEYRTEDSDPPHQVERRTRLRFPFELRVRFRSLGQAYPVAGAGWVRNISSGGVLVMYQHEVSAGTTLELHIDWPTRLEGRIPLQLVAVGTIVRCELFSFAVGLERYHFRIAGKQDLPSDESFGAGA